MTSTEFTQRVRRIGAERVAALAMPLGPQRNAALLHNDVLNHIRDCQQTRDSGLSAQCDGVDSHINGTVNPKRPFLTWQCCDTHKALKAERERLTERAAALGVELHLDMDQVIED